MSGREARHMERARGNGVGGGGGGREGGRDGVLRRVRERAKKQERQLGREGEERRGGNWDRLTCGVEG